MNLLNNRRSVIFVLFFVLCAGILSYAYGSIEEGPPQKSMRTHLFELSDLNFKKAKQSVESLLTTQERDAAHVEVFTVNRPEGDVTYLAVHDTEENLEKAAENISSLEDAPLQEAPLAPVQKVSLNFSDVGLNQVLMTMARAYDLNVLGGEDLSQKVTIHLKDVPIDEVFNIVLKSTGYTYVKEDNIIWIVHEENIHPPLKTEVFKLEYASAEKVKDAVSHLLSDEGDVQSFINFGKQENADCLNCY